MGKKKIIVTYEFDSLDVRRTWMQIMKENKDSMANGLRMMMKQLNLESDPAIYVKTDDNLVVVKKINTDKGHVLAYKDENQNELVTRPYKLIANNERYLMILEGALTVWFRRTGKVDEKIDYAFTDVENALLGLKEVQDPIETQKRIEQLDREWKEKEEAEKAAEEEALRMLK